MSKTRTLLLAALLFAVVGVALALSQEADESTPVTPRPAAAEVGCPDDLIGKLMEYKLKQRSLAGDYDPDRDAPDHLAPAWMEFDPDQSDEDCEGF